MLREAKKKKDWGWYRWGKIEWRNAKHAKYFGFVEVDFTHIEFYTGTCVYILFASIDLKTELDCRPGN